MVFPSPSPSPSPGLQDAWPTRCDLLSGLWYVAKQQKSSHQEEVIYTLVMIGDYKRSTLQYTKELMDDYEIE
jgi:hypothetical protein